MERILGETGVGPLTMLLADVSSTNNTDARMSYITKIVFAEAAHIEEKAESLTEVCNVAQATVGLAYQKEFATGGRGGGSSSGFIPRVRAMIEEKSGVKPASKKKAGNYSIVGAIFDLKIAWAIFNLKGEDCPSNLHL